MITASEPIERVHITRNPQVCGGKACVAGTRIRVLDIYVMHELQGRSVDEIVQEFPQLTMSDVFAALAYLWDHRDEVVESFSQEQSIADQLRGFFPSKLAEKLREGRVASIPPG